MKRFIITVALAVGISSLLNAQQLQATISFEKEIHDYGKIKESDGKVECQFDFTNTGGTPLVITNVKASCGCTTPNWTKQPIKPGEKGYVRVSFDPRNRPGPFTKTITVTSNSNPNRKLLRIKGEVQPREKTVEDLYPKSMGQIRLKTNHLAFVKVYNNQVKVDSLQIVNVSEENVKISFASIPRHLKLYTVPETLRPGQKGTLIGEYDGSVKRDWGFVVDRIMVKINGVSATGNPLTISAKIEEDFSSLSEAEKANAPKIQFKEVNYNFGETGYNKKVEHDYVFTNTGKTDLIIRKIRATCGCTTVAPDKKVIAPGESSSLKIVYSANRKGFARKTIYVISNDPTTPETRLTISGQVKD